MKVWTWRLGWAGWGTSPIESTSSTHTRETRPSWRHRRRSSEDWKLPGTHLREAAGGLSSPVSALNCDSNCDSALGCLVQDIDNMEPAKGIEPPTYGLRNRCSTPELRRHGADKNAHPTNAAMTPNSWVSILRGE